MKKRIALLLSLLMVATLFAGCKTNTPVNPTPTPATSPDAQQTPQVQVPEPIEYAADIVVIGAGGAGMTAAIQAVQDGAKNLVVLEKMPITGGNTTRSTGGLNAAETSFQEAQSINDTIDLFVEDTLKGGQNLNNPELVRLMAEKSGAAVDWVNSIGGDLSVVGMFGGASVMRIHRPTDTSAVGPMLVTTLNNKINELNIPVMLNTEATSILVDESGRVSGVTATGPDGEFEITCKAVILATGGFGANSDMVVQYNSKLAGFSTTNHAGATGSGIKMATELGAALVDIEQIQTHPTVNPDTSDMYTEGVRGNGAILINTQGKRFVNEMETRDVVSAAILAQPDSYCWLVFDQTVRDSLKAIEQYIAKGILFEADTIEELAAKIEVDPANLKASFETYAGYVKNKKDDEFGRNEDSMLSNLSKAKFYAGKCAPAIHHTMGGVKIDTSAQVIHENGSPIPGLFAAGEVTGGVHGANRLGGNAVTDIVVFGRIAGSSAVIYVEANGGHTEPTITVGPDDDNTPTTPGAQGNYTDGTFTGKGMGNNGEIEVEVTVENGNIVDIKLINHSETAGIYEAAEQQITSSIISTQQLDVDAVASASKSSAGIIEAVKNALGK
ncbi:flavocytochrome c [Eubacteriales bacterium OttesenSCG-928-K08]|nr:flavocytochrome c [Eubacteriales bacterium OttesenSCG-928-K08]